MKYLSQLTLSKKLIFLVLALLVPMVLVVTIAIVQLRSVSESQRAMYTGTVQPLRTVVFGGTQAAVHFRRMYPYILKTDAAARQQTAGLNEKTAADVKAAIDLLSSGDDPGLQAVGQKLQGKWAEYLASVSRLQAAADQGDQDAAFAELKAMTDPLHVELRGLMTEASKLQEQSAKEDTDKVAALVDRTAWLLSLLTLGATVVGGWLCYVVIRSVLGQLGGDPLEAMTIVGRIAACDLSVASQVKASDHGSLMYKLEEMRKQLSGLIQQVRDAAGEVATASNEISGGTSDLSRRTESQASALEQTSASMIELGSSAQRNAGNSTQAQNLTKQSSEIAGQAGEMVTQVIQTMNEISESSTKISDIIGVINGISFQTNILALNAAVEAARAGEQGRGFAVVANEVRALAQRSADAAKEIAQLIATSSERVERGTQVVSGTGETMRNLVQSIAKANTFVSEIAVVSGEQSAGVAQVREAVMHMDQATQQNAALVEQSAAAAESLSQQAAELVQAVAIFKL